MIRGVNENDYRNVNGFSETEIDEMCAFLQGAVYCWCKINQDKWFAARDLIGGDNFFWEGTPLFRLYEYYHNGDEQNAEYAKNEAGKAAGHLLKRVLIEDKRIFDTTEGFRTRCYVWTGEEIITDGLEVK